MATPSGPVESAFRYFKGYITYSQVEAFITSSGFTFDTARLSYIKSGGTEKLLGFAFVPFQVSTGANSVITGDINVMLMSVGAQGFTPGAFKAYPATQAQIGTNFTPGDTIDLGLSLSGASPEEAYNLLVNYNQSCEFGLTFLDYDSYHFFKTRFSSGNQNEGIAYCRSAISMPLLSSSTGSDYKNYRTLKFTPSPGPSNPQFSPDGLDDVAYRLGAPCPPIWHEVDSELAGGSFAPPLVPIMFSTDSEQEKGGGDDPLCSCLINPTDLRKALVDQGLIKDQFTRPINVWKYILTRLLVWGVILVVIALGATKLVATLAEKPG